jgi:hypothetical protein
MTNRSSGSCGGREFLRGPRDGTYQGYLVRENSWLQFPRTCVVLNVRYAPIATKVRSAAK